MRLLTQMGYCAVGLDKHAGAGLSADAAPSADASQSDACRIVRADLERPPQAADSCDGIVCECVLSLLHNPLAALRAACRALRPGGVVVLIAAVVLWSHRRPQVGQEPAVAPVLTPPFTREAALS